MVKKQNHLNSRLRIYTIIADILIFNGLYLCAYHLQYTGLLYLHLPDYVPSVQLIANLAYLICNFRSRNSLHMRLISIGRVLTATMRDILCFAALSILLFVISHCTLSIPGFAFIYGLYAVIVLLTRILYLNFIRLYRRRGNNTRQVVFLGSTFNLQDLYRTLSNPVTGYKISGYFNETPTPSFEGTISYLGKPEQAISYMKLHKPDILYCALPSSMQQIILPIILYCEKHMIRFYSVPNVRNYLKHSMKFELIGDTPVLGILEEPLELAGNKILKRTFDIAVSFVILLTVFPLVYIFTAAAIKLSSPGPVFFKQLRSGQDGKQFWCYKFRSMRVNNTSDLLACTINDPRKTKVGDFIRKTNIDELPQFYNVLKGDMSIVGPRPHMLKHTEEYGRLIEKFMLRYFVKPGITGWAQVKGYRGEIKELWQMEGRVKYDIWYIEHWSFWLDLRIIFMTVTNMFKGEKNAY